MVRDDNEEGLVDDGDVKRLAEALVIEELGDRRILVLEGVGHVLDEIVDAVDLDLALAL